MNETATSLSLINRAIASDDNAWTEFADRYSPLVYQWCRQSGLRPEDSADVLQEVFRTLISNLSRYRKRQVNDKFRAWLCTVTRNKIRDHRRVRRGKPDPQGGTNALEALLQVPTADVTSAGPMWKTNASQLVEQLNLIKNDFTEKTWLTFWRVTIDGISAHLVAEELGISTDSVYQAKSRVLKRLREEFGEFAENFVS